MELLLVKLLGAALLFLVVGMALTTSKKAGAIGMGGSTVWYLREVQSTGADLGTPDTNHAVPINEDSTHTDERTRVKVRGEDNEVYANLLDQKNLTFEGTLLQSDKATIDMYDEMESKYYRIYKQTGKRDGKTQEWIYGICQLDSGLLAKYKSGEVTKPVLRVVVLNNSAQISIANSALPTEKVTSTDPILIAAGKKFVLIET